MPDHPSRARARGGRAVPALGQRAVRGARASRGTDRRGDPSRRRLVRARRPPVVQPRGGAPGAFPRAAARGDGRSVRARRRQRVRARPPRRRARQHALGGPLPHPLRPPRRRAGFASARGRGRRRAGPPPGGRAARRLGRSRPAERVRAPDVVRVRAAPGARPDVAGAGPGRHRATDDGRRFRVDLLDARAHRAAAGDALDPRGSGRAGRSVPHADALGQSARRGGPRSVSVLRDGVRDRAVRAAARRPALRLGRGSRERLSPRGAADDRDPFRPDRKSLFVKPSCAARHVGRARIRDDHRRR